MKLSHSSGRSFSRGFTFLFVLLGFPVSRSALEKKNAADPEERRTARHDQERRQFDLVRKRPFQSIF
jgi:hypothetical protein